MRRQIAGGSSSVRRILEKGARRFRKSENKKVLNENFYIDNQSVFPVESQVKSKTNKKKRSSLKFSPVFGSKLGEDPKKSLRLLFVFSNLLPKLQRKREGIPQFFTLFYANYTILATQRGVMAQCPPPPKYALVVA